MRLINKGHIGDVWFRLEEYPDQLILSIGNKSTLDMGHPYYQIFFSSKDELNSVLHKLLGDNDVD